MWEYVGMGRTAEGLKKGIDALKEIQMCIRDRQVLTSSRCKPVRKSRLPLKKTFVSVCVTTDEAFRKEMCIRDSRYCRHWYADGGTGHDSLICSCRLGFALLRLDT